MHARRTWRRAAGAAVLVALVAAGCSGDDDGGAAGADDESGGLAIEVVSSRPEYVSGGDALVAVSLPEDVSADDVSVEAGDTDVTGAFAVDPADRARLVGLVEGLPEGESEITATAGDAAASVTVTDHPVAGPMFAGDQLPLYACTTESFGLEPATPADGCAAPTKVTWQYVDGAGQVHDFATSLMSLRDALLGSASLRTLSQSC